MGRGGENERRHRFAFNRRFGSLCVSVSLAVAATVACAPTKPPAQPSPPSEAPLPANALADRARPEEYLPAAGSQSLLVVDLQALRGLRSWAKALGLLVPVERRRSFAAELGIDPDQVTRLAWAQYPLGSAWVIATEQDNRRAGERFAERSVPGPIQHPVRHGVRRITGVVGDQPSALVLLGAHRVAWASPDPTLGRIVELRALGKLPKSPAILDGAGLRELPPLQGNCLVAWYATGPFEGERAAGLGGVLGRVTAASLRVPLSAEDDDVLVIDLVGDLRDEDAAPLTAAYQALLQGPLGRLLGLAEQPIATWQRTPNGYTLRLPISVLRLAEGLHQATTAEVADLMSAVAGPKQTEGPSAPRRGDGADAVPSAPPR